ncbi:MAG: hypothetical protein ABSG86_22545 [Thermoguttaceae bacterium]|jgi:hypothetical protein
MKDEGHDYTSAARGWASGRQVEPGRPFSAPAISSGGQGTTPSVVAR